MDDTMTWPQGEDAYQQMGEEERAELHRWLDSMEALDRLRELDPEGYMASMAREDYDPIDDDCLEVDDHCDLDEIPRVSEEVLRQRALEQPDCEFLLSEDEYYEREAEVAVASSNGGFC